MEHARFLGFVDGVGNHIYSINCACDHGDEYSETLRKGEGPHPGCARIASTHEEGVDFV